MYVLPPDLSETPGSRVTGITCPECAGSLEVQREGRGALFFSCRVGHTMSVDELLTGKEEKIEADVWAAVRGLEELAQVLEDLEQYALAHGREHVGGPHTGRIRQAREHAHRLRELLQAERPVDLSVGAAPGV
jgi:two-component system, chemotaxis family, protein-glutamate methylesterase/glutaminase